MQYDVGNLMQVAQHMTVGARMRGSSFAALVDNPFGCIDQVVTPSDLLDCMVIKMVRVLWC